MKKLFSTLKELAETKSWAPALLNEYTTINYDQLYQSSLQTANWLHSQNIKAGDRIGIFNSNSPIHFIVTLALLRIGAAQASFQTSDSIEQINITCEKCKIKTVISDREISNLQIEQIVLNFKKIQSFDFSKPLPSFDYPDKQTLALITVGSGTTGDPKIIIKTFQQLETLIFETNHLTPNSPSERFLSCTRIHFFGGKFRALLALTHGLCNVFYDESKISMTSIIERSEVTHIYAAVVHLEKLLAKQKEYYKNTSQDKVKPRFPNLKSLLVAGSPLTKELVFDIKKYLSPNLYVVYGTNEVSAVTLAAPNDLDYNPKTIGKLLPNADIQILDKDGKVITDGAVGNVRIKTLCMSTEYDNNPSATQKSFKEGWFYPNDLARIDENGYLFFEGRSDDLIIFEGVNIFPSEIETILQELPGVKESAAFPSTNNNGKVIPCVAIVLNQDNISTSQNLTEQYFQTHLRSKMGWRYPRLIKIMSELPRNPRGKVLRYKLQKDFKSHINNS
jgi:fatty-acyl-CoA synthase